VAERHEEIVKDLGWRLFVLHDEHPHRAPSLASMAIEARGLRGRPPDTPR
jgi:hypothetical protein